MCSWTAAWPPWTVAPFQHSLAQGLLTPECAESERLRVFEPESDSPVDQLAYSSCAALGQRRDGLLADGVVLRKVFVSREPSLEVNLGSKRRYGISPAGEGVGVA
jgi:hypothetical protein